MIKKLLVAAMITAAVGSGIQPALAAPPTFIPGKVKITNSTNGGVGVDQGIFDVSVTQDNDGFGHVVNPLLWHVMVSYYKSLNGFDPFIRKVEVKLYQTNAPDANSVGEPIAKNGASNGKVDSIDWDGFVIQREGDFLAPTDDITGQDVAGSRIRQGHKFTGDILLRPNNHPIAGVYFNLVGSASGTGYFPGAAGVTPEGASLLLLLPGLIPVAVGLRRRRLNKPAGE